jgi:hypothetical protein
MSGLRLSQPGWSGPDIYIPQGTGWPSYTPRDRVPISSPLMTRRATAEVEVEVEVGVGVGVQFT